MAGNIRFVGKAGTSEKREITSQVCAGSWKQMRKLTRSGSYLRLMSLLCLETASHLQHTTPVDSSNCCLPNYLCNYVFNSVWTSDFFDLFPTFSVTLGISSTNTGAVIESRPRLTNVCDSSFTQYERILSSKLFLRITETLLSPRPLIIQVKRSAEGRTAHNSY